MQGHTGCDHSFMKFLVDPDKIQCAVGTFGCVETNRRSCFVLMTVARRKLLHFSDFVRNPCSSGLCLDVKLFVNQVFFSALVIIQSVFD